MDWHPIALAKLDEGKRIEIRWSDGETQVLRARAIRDACPCATCREKAEALEKETTRNQLRILSDAELTPLTVQKMNPAGNYAYVIQFSDGHQSGVFTFDVLRQIENS